MTLSARRAVNVTGNANSSVNMNLLKADFSRFITDSATGLDCSAHVTVVQASEAPLAPVSFGIDADPRAFAFAFDGCRFPTQPSRYFDVRTSACRDCPAHLVCSARVADAQAGVALIVESSWFPLEPSASQSAPLLAQCHLADACNPDKRAPFQCAVTATIRCSAPLRRWLLRRGAQRRSNFSCRSLLLSPRWRCAYLLQCPCTPSSRATFSIALFWIQLTVRAGSGRSSCF